VHVVIVTKSTLDKEAKISVDDFGALTWDDTQTVINPWDEYSVTEAILLKEAYSVKVTALSVGTELDNVALKLALAIGADEAVRLWDDSMQGQDSLGYATAVAAAIVKIGDVDQCAYLPNSAQTRLARAGFLLEDCVCGFQRPDDYARQVTR
jgi:electron transfer flavoprotein beta subunit